MFRIKKQIILMLLTGAFLTACGQNEVPVETGVAEQEDKLLIGMCFDSFVIERWQRDRDIFVQAAKELGAEVNVQNANGDVEKQKEQIDYLVKKGVDVLVIVCIDSDALTESVAAAKNAGVEVIAYDRLINNADIDLYISFDNEMVGTLMAQSLIDEGLSGGKVIMIGGSTADNNVSLVEDAFEKVMDENDVEILDRTHCDGWRAELASEYIYEHRELVSECDAIMCGNDNVASQVASSLAVQRLAGKIMVTGQDADLEACQRIVEGTQIMTVYKPVDSLARRAAECAVALAQEGEIQGEDVGEIDNGEKEIPFVRLEPVKVTIDNMDEVIIDSGFHSKEEVYLNVK